jgi:hypothetical protein
MLFPDLVHWAMGPSLTYQPTVATKQVGVRPWLQALGLRREVGLHFGGIRTNTLVL